MNRKVFRVGVITVLILLLGVTGYAKEGLMAKVDRVLSPKPDQALIVFMRPSSLGLAISASIFDVTGDTAKFLGIQYYKTKIAYDVAPGEYTFMVISESADFMKATVSAGKTYYALVMPRIGAMKARFSFKPLRQTDLASSDFAKWDSATYLVDNTPNSEEWAQKNSPDIEKKRARYWPVWSEKSPEDRDAQTLHSEDGR